MKIDILSILKNDDIHSQRCVVKITTSVWGDRNGMYTKKSLRFLRRKCVGYNLLEEDILAINAKEVCKIIINLNECSDGEYQVVTCNESRDWETGIIEDYDYMLIPYFET